MPAQSNVIQPFSINTTVSAWDMRSYSYSTSNKRSFCPCGCLGTLGGILVKDDDYSEIFPPRATSGRKRVGWFMSKIRLRSWLGRRVLRWRRWWRWYVTWRCAKALRTRGNGLLRLRYWGVGPQDIYTSSIPVSICFSFSITQSYQSQYQSSNYETPNI